ncbi:MAG TPA: heavy metal translocating P-type ATPase, partial [Chthonomonadaceae bacterium]|nr:heavy metal translocating P-type ATPase [Chthonomonadaceae bacterium]
LPLIAALTLGGVPLVLGLMKKLVRREFGSDLLAGISIVTSAALHEYLAGAIVVLMLSGGEALESYAARGASSVLGALANRMPTTANMRRDGEVVEVALAAVEVGDTVVVLPHQLCPVDGTVIAGHGSMDESYLTGEPYQISKAPGTAVLSGAVNGESALEVRCERRATDSRYAKIMRVMRDSEQQRPRLRRLGDRLGAWYTPAAVLIGLGAWAVTGDRLRFLAVIVVATPCPLLIAIPTAIIGSIALAARMGIIIKDPAVLEAVSTCRTAIFDKTGTLTYGRPKLTEIVLAQGFDRLRVLALVAGLERYSKHPLSGAIAEAAAAESVPLGEAFEVTEAAGKGLLGRIAGHLVTVTGRTQLGKETPKVAAQLPSASPGMECVVLVDGEYAALFRFRDEPRPEGARFIRHLDPRHGVRRVMLVSADREEEVAYLADRVGIPVVFSGQSPEDKLALVRIETAKAPTIFLGDGINDAPALTAATVGIAFGNNSEITGEAADAVILDSSLEKVDVLFHVGRRMRSIALQSAIGGMALGLVGMALAASGRMSPVAGAVSQEAIDVLAVLNALRAVIPPAVLADY